MTKTTTTTATETKTCFVCNETKPVAAFAKNRYMPQGVVNHCKACAKNPAAVIAASIR